VPGQAYALLQAMLQAMTCGPNSMRRQYGQVLSFSTAPVAGVQHLGMPTTGTQPVLTVNQPTPNAVVGLQPFHIAGQVTDRGGSEPITIDSVTVQIDGGPLIPATLKTIHNKTLTQVSFDTSAQISGGNDPHTVTVVATNDQGQRTTKTVTVYTGALVQVDAPAVLLDFVTRASFKADDPEVLALIGGIQRQLGSLSDTLASAGKVLIGPNLIVQALTAYESLVRVGFWIENPDFPVVAPSAAFPLPRLSDAAAAAAFAATTVLTTPALGTLASFALSIPVTTLQHLVDATKPALKTQAALQGFALDTVTVQTSGPATVNTNVTGHVLEGILPASFTISETVGTQAVPGGPSTLHAPAVQHTDSSSSTGSILDWVAGVFLPLIGEIVAYAILADASIKVSSSASQKSGLAASLVGSIPARIPFGSKAFSLSPGSNYQFPEFPTLCFDWDSFVATDLGLLGIGTADIESRTQADVTVRLGGPDFLIGFQDSIQELTDPTMSYVLDNLAPDAGNFGWQMSGAGSQAESLEPPSPVVQADNFYPHFPLPLKVGIGDYHFNLAIHAVETCQSDPSKTLTGAASRAMLFRVKKRPPPQ